MKSKLIIIIAFVLGVIVGVASFFIFVDTTATTTTDIKAEAIVERLENRGVLLFSPEAPLDRDTFDGVIFDLSSNHIDVIPDMPSIKSIITGEEEIIRISINANTNYVSLIEKPEEVLLEEERIFFEEFIREVGVGNPPSRFTEEQIAFSALEIGNKLTIEFTESGSGMAEKISVHP